MNYLVDTQIFLWCLFSHKKISKTARSILINPEFTKYVSSITFWEISLKFSLGKLDLTGVLPNQLPRLAKEAGFEILNLDCETSASFYNLPRLKNMDPFDRMLVWQAVSYDYQFLTKDAGLTDYKKCGLKIVR